MTAQKLERQRGVRGLSTIDLRNIHGGGDSGAERETRVPLAAGRSRAGDSPRGQSAVVTRWQSGAVADVGSSTIPSPFLEGCHWFLFLTPYRAQSIALS